MSFDQVPGTNNNDKAAQLRMAHEFLKMNEATPYDLMSPEDKALADEYRKTIEEANKETLQ